MKHPLLYKIDVFRRSYRRAVWEYALIRTFLFAAVFFAVASLVDYAMYRLWLGNYPELRTLILVGFGGLLLSKAWKLAYVFRAIPRSRQETARLLRSLELQTLDSESQHQEPEPKPTSEQGRGPSAESLPATLESALDFLEEPTHASESEELRAEVIRRTTQQLERVSFRSRLNAAVVRQKRWWRRGLAAGFAVLFLVCGVVMPENTRTAWLRFFHPWNAPVWNWGGQIRWKEIPHELMRGEDFQAVLDVHGKPRWVNVAVWKPDTPMERPEVYRIQPIDGEFQVRLPQVQRMFRIVPFWEGQHPDLKQAARVNVLTPPSLLDAKIQIVPPKYTRRPRYAGDWNIADLSGSKIGILITADRPLRSARVSFHNGTYVPGELFRNDASICMFRFELLGDVAYHLELTDTDGRSASLETWNIRDTFDQKPQVELLQPENGRPVLPEAQIQLKVRGLDDIGLTALGYRWLAENPETPTETTHRTPRWTTFALWNPPVKTPIPSKETEFTWNLQPLKLATGTQIQLEALAEDANNAQSSGERVTLRVVSESEMAQYVLQQWITVVQELSRFSETVAQIPASETRLAALQSALRMVDDEYPDSFLRTLRVLQRDLRENPPFALTPRIHSEEHAETVSQLLLALDETSRRWLPELRQLIHEGNHSSEVQASNAPKVQAAVDAIQARIQPFLQEWNEHEAAGRLAERLAEMAQRYWSFDAEMPSLEWDAQYGRPIVSWPQAPQAEAEAQLKQNQQLLTETGAFFADYRSVFGEVENPHEAGLMASLLWQTASLVDLEIPTWLEARLEQRRLWGRWLESDAGRRLFSSNLARLVHLLKLHEAQQAAMEQLPNPLAFPVLAKMQKLEAQELTDFPVAELPKTLPLVLRNLASKYTQTAEALEALAVQKDTAQEDTQAEIGQGTATNEAPLNAQRERQKALTSAIAELRRMLEETPNIDVPTRDSDMENKAEPGNKTEDPNAEEDLLEPPTVVDIQILLAEQEAILHETETLQKTETPDEAAKAEATHQLEIRERGVVAMGEALVFRTS